MAKPGCSERGDGGDRLLLHMIKTYIDQHFFDLTLNLDRLIQRFAVSRATLYRLFKDEGGASSYINQVRLTHSVRMLIGDKKQAISDIAFCSGFADPSYFTRTFKKAYGLTPSQMRDMESSSETISSAEPVPDHMCMAGKIMNHMS